MKHIFFISLTLLANVYTIYSAATYEKVAVKDADKKKNYDISHLVKVHPGKDLEYQCAGRLGGFGSTLIGCIVADPKLTEHFPIDAAEQIAGLIGDHWSNLSLYGPEIRSLIKQYHKQNINADILKTGKMASRLTGIFLINDDDVFSKKDVPEFSVYFPGEKKSYSCKLNQSLFLSIKKNTDDIVEYSSFHEQPHIKALAERGEEALITEAWDEALAEADYDIALYVDHAAVKSLLDQTNKHPGTCCTVL